MKNFNPLKNYINYFLIFDYKNRRKLFDLFKMLFGLISVIVACLMNPFLGCFIQKETVFKSKFRNFPENFRTFS